MRREAPHHTARLPGLRPGEGSRVHGPASLPGLLLTLVLVPAGPAGPATAAAQTLLTQDEALALAFPAPTEVERRSAYLTDGQLDRARTLAGDDVEIDQTVVTYSVGRRDGRYTGAAYFDVHRVRTKNEVVMIVVDPDHRIRRTDVLKFIEPPEYMAPDAWVEQLEGRRLDEALSVRGEIRTITGATLTARAMTEAARRVLALHAVIEPFGGAP